MRKVILALTLSLGIALGVLATAQPLIQGLSGTLYVMLLAPFMATSLLVFSKVFNTSVEYLKVKIEKIEITYLKILVTSIYIVSYSALGITHYVFTTKTKPEAMATIIQVAAHMGSDYGLLLFLDCSEARGHGFDIKDADINSEDLSGVKRIYEQIGIEIKKYPQSFIKNLDFKKIYLGTELTSDNDSIAGYSSFGGQFIALDFNKQNEYFIKGIFHHEIFHQIHGQLEKEGSDILARWSKLNSPGFKYAGDFSDYMAVSRHDPMNYVRDKGFASSYSRTNPKEDMCEVFKMLVSTKWHRGRMAELLEGDLVLKSKVDFMKTIWAEKLKLELVVEDTIYFKEIESSLEPEPKKVTTEEKTPLGLDLEL